MRLARDASNREIDATEFASRAESLVSQFPGTAGDQLDRRPAPLQGRLCGAQRSPGAAACGRRGAAPGRHREQLRAGARAAPAGVLAAGGRRRPAGDAAAAHSAVRPGPVRRHGAGRVLDRRPAALRHALGGLGALCGVAARRQGRPDRRQHGRQSARAPERASCPGPSTINEYEVPVSPVGNAPDAARAGLSHLAGRGRQRAVLAGRRAQRAHELDADRHLAPHAAPAPGPAGAGGRNQLPARDGKLDADRHARARPRGPHHLRQRRLLRDDGLGRRANWWARRRPSPTGWNPTARS